MLGRVCLSVLSSLRSACYRVRDFPQATPDVTGMFEVQLVGGALLHSRKNGDGYVDSQKKLDKIIDGVSGASRTPDRPVSVQRSQRHTHPAGVRGCGCTAAARSVRARL